MNDEISDLIESVDLASYVAEVSGCEYKQKGGELWCCSPINPNDATPSFSVKPEMNRFMDFSSGASGNIIDFIKAYNRTDFVGALGILKAYAGVDDASPKPKKHLKAASVAASFKPKKISNSNHSVLSAEVMNSYMPRGNKAGGWLKEGITNEIMDRHEVKYDPFSNALVFPIRDEAGKIINVLARRLGEDFKNRGLSKYIYYYSFGDGGIDILYDLYLHQKEIRDKGEVILFEGSKSCMKAESWGYYNTAAILTSHLNPRQLKTLIKLGVSVTFALDKEIDVRKDKNIKMLRMYVPVYYFRDSQGLLDDKDSPADKGREVFEALYENKRRL